MSRSPSWWHFKRYCEGRRDRIGMNALWELSATKLPLVPKKGIVRRSRFPVISKIKSHGSMIISTSVLTQLLQIIPQLRPQLYFKSSLTALSHAMEDQVLAGTDKPLVIASFQRERFYRQEAHRYRRIAQRTSQVYVLASPETEFKTSSEFHETIAFEPGDCLCQEWHLLVIGQDYCSCLICHERLGLSDEEKAIDQFRRFEGIWTFDSVVTSHAAELY